MECWASVGRQGQQESWAQSNDCHKACWENPHCGGESITVARAMALPVLHALRPGFPPPLPAAEGPPVRKGMLGIAALDFAAKGEAVEAGRVGAVLSSTHCRGSRPCEPPWETPWTPAGAATHSEFRERRPWKASGAISAIWLLLRSLQ